MREAMLSCVKNQAWPYRGSCCGANPGMVSWLVKQALLDLARDMKIAVMEPTTREPGAKLMKRLGVKPSHCRTRHPAFKNRNVDVLSTRGPSTDLCPKACSRRNWAGAPTRRKLPYDGKNTKRHGR